MVMSLDIQGHFFWNMETIKGDTFPELQYLHPGSRFTTGHQSFDDICEILCHDNNACSTYLAPRRMTALPKLFSLDGESRVSITNRGSHILFRSKRIIKNAPNPDYIFNTLLRVAPELDS
jgi:hypothetical protein